MRGSVETGLATPRILLIVVDVGTSQRLSDALSQEGFLCEARQSGEEALKALEREPFDVVIAELSLSGISGLALVEEGRRKYPSSAFLLATDDGDIRAGLEGMRRGAADCLLKPFQLDGVVASVYRALRMKRLEQQLEKYKRDLECLVDDRTLKLLAAIQRVDQAHDDAMEVLGAALDARDDETGGHAQRVTRYCLEIAKRMGCPTEQLEAITRGAYLHDIGKIGIPDAILLKKGKLTPQERAVMQVHVEIGHNLIKRAVFMAPAAEIVLAHHERYDGMGYPRGLKGEEIPLEARIFAVADTLDAMTSDRPYRRALPFSVARAEIVCESGRQFDPKVAQAFLSVPERLWENIRLEVSRLRGKTGPDVAKLSLIWHRWGGRHAASS
jgi:putative nucleotidyltransferase with HDIG domain